MKNNTFSFLLLFILLLNLSACGGSSGSGPLSHLSEADQKSFKTTMLNLFDAIDADKDGYLTKDEFEAAFIAKFKQYDADGDLTLEQEDFDSDQNTTHSLPYDTDNDGVASKDEYLAYYRNIFKEKLDLDGSTKVSREEYLEAFLLE